MHRKIRYRAPINGMRPMRSHHPLWLVSCRRRTATASDGMRSANRAMHTKIPASPINIRPVAASIKPMSKLRRATASQITVGPMAVNSQNHQYSERGARPLKVANFSFKHVVIASVKPIMLLNLCTYRGTCDDVVSFMFKAWCHMSCFAASVDTLYCVVASAMSGNNALAKFIERV